MTSRHNFLATDSMGCQRVSNWQRCDIFQKGQTSASLRLCSALLETLFVALSASVTQSQKGYVGGFLINFFSSSDIKVVTL